MKKFSVAVHTHYNDYYHRVVEANDWLSALREVCPNTASIFMESDYTLEQAMNAAEEQEWWFSVIEL